MSRVEKKLKRNSSRNGSDGRVFPSTLMDLGTSGTRLMAALKKASAVRQEGPRVNSLPMLLPWRSPGVEGTCLCPAPIGLGSTPLAGDKEGEFLQ